MSLLTFFTKDWKLKGFALLIALALFMVVRNDKDTEGTITVEVRYVNQPSTMTLMNKLLFSVKLLVRGPWTRVKKLTRQKRSTILTVDLSEVRGGRYELDSTMFKLPKGIRVTSISPSHLPIRMEALLTRTIPVTLGKVKTGRFFTPTEILLRPDKVTIRGPKSDVLSVLSIPLPSLTITKAGVTEKTFTLPELPPRLVLTPNVAQIAVRITVEKIKESKSFPAIPLLVDGELSGTGSSLSHSVVKVVVTGDKKALFGLSPALLKPYVVIPKEFNGPTLDLPILLRTLPPGFKVKTYPNTVRLTKTPLKHVDKRKE